MMYNAVVQTLTVMAADVQHEGAGSGGDGGRAQQQGDDQRGGTGGGGDGGQAQQQGEGPILCYSSSTGSGLKVSKRGRKQGFILLKRNISFYPIRKVNHLITRVITLLVGY